MGRSLGVFYTDNGFLYLQDPEWLYCSINILIGLLQRIGLAYNVDKSKIMTCQPGAILSGMSEEQFCRISTGEGDTYLGRLRRRVVFPC